MTSKEEILINQVAIEQQRVIKLTRQNNELLQILEDYKSLLTDSEIHFKSMTDQRDQFMQLAKNLDKDFNQSKIFSK